MSCPKFCWNLRISSFFCSLYLQVQSESQLSFERPDEARDLHRHDPDPVIELDAWELVLETPIERDRDLDLDDVLE